MRRHLVAAAAALAATLTAPAQAYPWDPDVAAECWIAGPVVVGTARYTGTRQIVGLDFVCRFWAFEELKDVPGTTVGPVSVVAAPVPDGAIFGVCAHATVRYADGTVGEAQPTCWPPPIG